MPKKPRILTKEEEKILKRPPLPKEGGWPYHREILKDSIQWIPSVSCIACGKTQEGSTLERVEITNTEMIYHDAYRYFYQIGWRFGDGPNETCGALCPVCFNKSTKNEN